MAPTYKLTYFGIRGLAEPIRLLFHYAKVDFEDNRLNRDDWATLKAQYPWGVLPVLEVDGKELSQSSTIFRYLGKKFGLAGENEFETAKCDEYMDAMVDIRTELIKVFRESDETKKAEMRKNIKENVIPKGFGKLNEILKKNGTGYLVGKKLTYADIFIAYFVDNIISMSEHSSDMASSVATGFPELDAHRKKVMNLDGIKEWLAKRPVTPM